LADDHSPFAAGDLPLLAALGRHNTLLCAVLCMLARRGAAMRRDEPARERAWTEVLSVYPHCKDGQFLFDLLEWQDFMLDGNAPPVLDDAALAAALDRASQALEALSAALEGQPGGVAAEAAADAMPGADNLPPLAGDVFLYPDVVPGAIAATTRLRLPAVEPPDVGRNGNG
jgi:hypothetical protein